MGLEAEGEGGGVLVEGEGGVLGLRRLGMDEVWCVEERRRGAMGLRGGFGGGWGVWRWGSAELRGAGIGFGERIKGPRSGCRCWFARFF